MTGASTTAARPWRSALRAYERPRTARAMTDLATSVVPFLGLVAGVVVLLPTSVLAVLLMVPAAGFLLRTFIVFHDCAHGSFLPSRRANRWIGRVLGLLVWTPFGAWKLSHAAHHATTGDLDRRGHGDVPTMTVREFRAAPWRTRLAYRLFRHPAVMFTIGPFVAMVVLPRLPTPGSRPRIRNSVVLNDLGLLLLASGFVVLFGWQTFLLVQLPLVVLAGGAGVWLFFVQHQFEDAYWERGDEWTYDDAALRGSSYLRLPRVLRFFSGNIGLHHVHHLSARIPNYHLQAAHDDNDVFHSVPVLTLRDGLRATRLKLWDEDARCLVPFGSSTR